MQKQYYGTGRRKTSSARVFIKAGKGNFVVNKKNLEDYFSLKTDKQLVFSPLKLLNMEKNFDVYTTVKGGGSSGQAGALRLGLTRALLEFNSEHRASLKEAGFLTRDSRKVERKKYGQKGARAKFQHSKR